MAILNLQQLKTAVSGDSAAIRRVTRLIPITPFDKIFPPTYEGGEYAEEDRIVRDADGSTRTEKTVLLDSVQSQSNRLELALLRGYREGKLKFPMILVDFAEGEENPILRDIGQITALEAPHRMVDAIFRDSLLGKSKFRESGLGRKLDAAKVSNATPVFEIAPHALDFGFWDSTGPRGGLGAKVQRALVSEIIGCRTVAGTRPSSRIDPLQIEREGVEVFKKKDGDWTTDPNEAELKDGSPVKYGKEGKPSELNHGNITPSLRYKDKTTRELKLNPGGFTIAYAVQTTVLSLAALRRLRFPVSGAKAVQVEVDKAARTVVAALGLAAITWLDLDGYDLRSRCLLDGPPGTFEFVGRGNADPFSLDANGAAALLDEAVAEATAVGLPWPTQPVILKPSPELKQLILKSRAKTAAG